ncbi:MAG TPA: histidine phosphatase family protein [Armatimonadota bacterium]
MTRLLIVRHGETDWNADARVQGYSDIPMNAAGRAQVQLTAAELAEEGISAVYASDLSRARVTGDMIAAPHRLAVQILPALRERCWGAWEGRSMPELAADDPANYARLQAGDWVTPDGAEDYDALQDRIVGAIEQIAADHADETVVVAAHGGPIKVFTAWVLGAPVAAHHRMRIGNASVTTVILRDGRFVLESYNVPPREAVPEPPNPGKTLIESAF